VLDLYLLVQKTLYLKKMGIINGVQSRVNIFIILM
jgi:hypothetical protein